MQIMSAHHTPDLEETTSITNPKPTVDIRAYGLYGCWEKQSRTLTVWSYAGRHQAKGLLHRTFIALSLARALSQSDRLFPSVQQTSHGYQYKNKISPAQSGSCAGLETSIRIPKPNPTETEREAENVDQDAAARGVKCKKQTGCPRGTSEYAHGIVQVSTDEELSWRRWSTTLMWYVYKKQGHAQIDH